MDVDDTEQLPLLEQEAVRRGRLFQLKLKRSLAARAEALGTIRPVPAGGVQVRIGGRMRGKTHVFSTRAKAEAAVDAHYNEAMLKAVQDLNKGR
jgi:hypothetical protein